MIIHKKTLAVSTAALVMTGGAAYAFISAGNVSGTGAVTTAKVNSDITLYLEKGAGLDPLNGPDPQSVPVFADNKTNVTLKLPTVVAALDKSGWGDCPPDSFSVTYNSITADVKKNATTQVGTVTVKFNELGVPQDACNGLPLTVTFGPVI